MKTLIVAFYKFVSLPAIADLRQPLLRVCRANGVKGTILLAPEGLNSTIAGSESGVLAVLEYLEADPNIGELTVKKSWDNKVPFYRMKVRLKKEIVRLGMPEVNPNNLVGQYVAPDDWNALISDPEVTVIDTRNSYEFELGTFHQAIDPKTDHFREFPNFVRQKLSGNKEQKIAMFCTGGIRCEKATAFLREDGFENVYHLQGGILNYLEKVGTPDSLWTGDCFVFDNRVTVDHQLQPGEYSACHSCRHALSSTDLASPQYTEGVSCPHCHDNQTTEQRERAAERQKQVERSRELGREHLGVSPEDLAAWRQAKLNKPTRRQRNCQETSNLPDEPHD